MNGILYNDCIIGWRLLATLSAESNRLTHMSNQISIYITLMIIEEIYYRVTQELYIKFRFHYSHKHTDNSRMPP